MHAFKRSSGLRVGTILFLAVALFAPAAHAIIVRPEQSKASGPAAA